MDIEDKKAGFPTLDELDMRTIHEAYQFLYNKYVVTVKNKKVQMNILSEWECAYNRFDRESVEEAEKAQKKKMLGMVSNKKSSVIIFGHKHFYQNFRHKI